MNQLAFAYIRRSSYKQQQNHSVETQKTRILDFAQKNGLLIPEEFIVIEDVTSAYSKKASQRKALMKLKEQMIETGINYVVFNEESRMDRTGYTFVLDFYRPLFQHFGKVYVYTTESDQVWSPENQHVKIAFILYHQESTIKSERAIGDLKAHLQSEEGKRPGSKVPFGYKQIDKELIPDEKSHIVSFIYYLHSWGHSMGQIANCLNIAGIPSASNGQWAISSIESILKNKVYTGTLQWNIKKGKEAETFIFPSSHYPIVSEALTKLIRVNHQLQQKHGRLKTPFLLLNKVWCNQCNEQLICKNLSTTRDKKKYHYRYYICENCAYKWPINELHSIVTKELNHFLAQLTTNDTKQQMIQQFIQQHRQFLDHCIEDIEQKLNLLLTKEKLAKAHSDQHFLDLIIHKNEEMILEREVLNDKQLLLENMQDSLINGEFLKRFSLVPDETLHNQEIRLIIMYFVESIIVSSSTSPRIIFSLDILRDIF